MSHNIFYLDFEETVKELGGAGPMIEEPKITIKGTYRKEEEKKEVNKLRQEVNES